MFAINEFNDLFKDPFKMGYLQNKIKENQTLMQDQLSKVSSANSQRQEKATKFFQENILNFDKDTFLNQIKKVTTEMEEKSKKLSEFTKENMKNLEIGPLGEQIKQLTKFSEENTAKVMKIIDGASKNTNYDELMKKINEFSVHAKDSAQKAIDLFEENAKSFDNKKLLASVEKVNSVIESNNKISNQYFKKQQDNFLTFQKEMLSAFLGSEIIKDVPGVLSKYSKLVATENVNIVSEGFQSLSK